MCRNVALWCALCFAPVCSAGLFDNKEQQAEKLFRQNEFETAAEAFSDSYRRGVAQYRAGQYGQAAESFNRVQRESVKTDALYNLGNSRFQEGKLEAAAKAYREVLLRQPDNEDARHNLGLTSAMLAETSEEEKQNQREQEQREQQDDEEKKEQDEQQKKSGNKKSEQQKQDEKQSEKQQSSDDQQQQEEQEKEEQQESSGEQSDQQQQSGDEPSEQQDSSGEQSDKQQQSGDEPSGQQDTSGDQEKQGVAGNDRIDQLSGRGDDEQEQRGVGDGAETEDSSGDEPSENADTFTAGSGDKDREAGGNNAGSRQQAGIANDPRDFDPARANMNMGAIEQFDQLGRQADPEGGNAGLPGEAPDAGGNSTVILMDQLLDQVEGDPVNLMRNQFRLEEQRMNQTGGQLYEPRPW